MGVGLQVINQDNIIQIDENQFNMQLKTKASLSWAFAYSYNIPFGGTTSIYHASITVSGLQAPIVAINGDFYVSTYRLAISGSDWTYYFKAGSDCLTLPSTVYIFDRADVVGSPSNFGLEVYNDQGQRTFHSDNKSAKMVNFLGPVSGSGVSMDIPAGKTYAIANAKMGSSVYTYNFGIPPNQTTGWYWTSTGVRTSSTTAYVNRMLIGGGTGSSSPPVSGYGYYPMSNNYDTMAEGYGLVLDVTGY